MSDDKIIIYQEALLNAVTELKQLRAVVFCYEYNQPQTAREMNDRAKKFRAEKNINPETYDDLVIELIEEKLKPTQPKAEKYDPRFPPRNEFIGSFDHDYTRTGTKSTETSEIIPERVQETKQTRRATLNAVIDAKDWAIDQALSMQSEIKELRESIKHSESSVGKELVKYHLNIANRISDNRAEALKERK